MFIERFINYLKFEKRFSPHTISAYTNDLNQFYQFMSGTGLAVEEATHSEVRGFIVELMDRGADARTVNRKLSVLRSYYKFLLREELVRSSPMPRVKAPKAAKKLPVFLQEDSLNALLDHGTVFPATFEGLRDHLIIELLFDTGMRLAELISLKEADVDKWQASIKVTGKRNKQRLIPINSMLLKAIEAYLKEKSSRFEAASDHLIVGNTGAKVYPVFVYRTVRKYLSFISTQSKRSPHVLRHSFATSLLNNGADLNAIKELLGHSSLAATQVYTHNSVEKLKAAYKQAHPKA